MGAVSGEETNIWRLRNRAVGAARRVREELGLGLLDPLADVLETIEDDGVAVALLDLGDGLAGAYLSPGGTPVAFVNGRQAPQRQRFTLAHEYAHHRLGHGDTVDEPPALADWTSDPCEVQANAFAAEFLVPRTAARRWAAHHLDPPITLETVVRFAAHFGVSAQAACIRLKSAGVLTDEALSDRLQGEIEQCLHHGMVDDLGLEVPDDAIAREAEHLPRLPGVLRRSLFGDLLSGRCRIEEAAARIGRSPAQLRAAVQAVGLDPLVGAAGPADA